MPIKFLQNGREVSLNDFTAGIFESALEQVTDELRQKGSSVVDPETGKHAPVFVRRIGTEGWSIWTSGSTQFAHALEKRLGLGNGEVHAMGGPATQERLVYLAHASEDKSVAKPIAEGLISKGIHVWYDNWEIGYGDSLRRKMEQGLGDCTHFIVLLTANSIKKPWVNEEIDAGLMRAVDGKAKFIGLRHDLPLDALSPFLKTRLTPEFVPGEEGLDELASQIFGVSRRPHLGDKPSYVQAHKPGSTWSAAARTVAEYFIRKSENAAPMDPQADFSRIQSETGLPLIDVRIGVLDLVGAGLLERRDLGGDYTIIWPKGDLFVEFDAEFMEWDPAVDARDLAVCLINLDRMGEFVSASEVAGKLQWPPRRFNPAATYLSAARIVKPIDHLGGDAYSPSGFRLGDELLRFTRDL